MELTFSDEEYRRLMLLVFMGEWMMNSIQKTPDLAFESLAFKVFAKTQGTALEPLVMYDEPTESWELTDDFDAEAHAFIDQYDEITFWEELTGRLVERDLIDQHGERALRSMRPEQRSKAAAALAKAYTKVFEDEGLTHLHLTE
jgi:hypothetical protein